MTTTHLHRSAPDQLDLTFGFKHLALDHLGGGPSRRNDIIVEARGSTAHAAVRRHSPSHSNRRPASASAPHYFSSILADHVRLAERQALPEGVFPPLEDFHGAI